MVGWWESAPAYCVMVCVLLAAHSVIAMCFALRIELVSKAGEWEGLADDTLCAEMQQHSNKVEASLAQRIVLWLRLC